MDSCGCVCVCLTQRVSDWTSQSQEVVYQCGPLWAPLRSRICACHVCNPVCRYSLHMWFNLGIQWCLSPRIIVCTGTTQTIFLRFLYKQLLNNSVEQENIKKKKSETSDGVLLPLHFLKNQIKKASGPITVPQLAASLSHSFSPQCKTIL